MALKFLLALTKNLLFMTGGQVDFLSSVKVHWKQIVCCLQTKPKIRQSYQTITVETCLQPKKRAMVAESDFVKFDNHKTAV